jgi:regulatory protein
MIITKLERQKRNKGRVSIYSDNSFRLGVLEDTVFKFGLRIGDKLTDEQFKEIKEYDEYISGKKIALNLLAYRNRSREELRKKLAEKKLSSAVIEKVLAHTEKLGFVNDRQFAKEFAEGKIGSRPQGRKTLFRKLLQKGVAKEIIEGTLDKLFTKIDEKDLAEECFYKYFSKVKDKEVMIQKKKIFEHLTRKGFSYDIINELIREKIEK